MSVCCSLLSLVCLGTAWHTPISGPHAPCDVLVQEEPVPRARWSVRHQVSCPCSLRHSPSPPGETTNSRMAHCSSSAVSHCGGLGTTTTCQRKVAAIAVPCGVTLNCRFVHVSTC
ncbi:hypothetical protein V8C26DRAFT_386513, partial [Trichoderma gracile]